MPSRSTAVKKAAKQKQSLFEAPPASEDFYSECLKLMTRSGIPFLLSGAYALTCYTGVTRPTKDMDVFAKAGDALRMLALFKEQGFDVEVVDERWLARITRGGLFVDVIHNMPTASVHVTDDWFDEAPTTKVYGTNVRLVPPTEFIWSKIFVQDHSRYDGADVAHFILKQGESIDWRKLLSHMENYWEVLLIALLNFRFIYPSERNIVPRWLMDELIERMHNQLEMPPAELKVCRGRIFSPRDYAVDISQWGFSDVIGNLEEQYAEQH